MASEEPIFGVSDFVAVLNQTLEFAYPSVLIQGELAELRVSRGRWVYFKLKDDYATVNFFGSVQQLPGPLENGLMLQVRGMPRHHPLYGFTVNVQFMQPVGEGSLRRAADLLLAKLTAEGLFDADRKRFLPYPPTSVGLITSGESAAYHDFIKILNERWGGVEVRLLDVLVQGESAPGQIMRAIEYFNQHADAPDVLVITRGGGSAEDLAAFSSEQVTRAVAGSRIPTLIAIGHEVDISLAELAADQRASTPSNAATMLTPDKTAVLQQLGQIRHELARALSDSATTRRQYLKENKAALEQAINRQLADSLQNLRLKRQILAVLNPESVLKRGYAIVRAESKVILSGKNLKQGNELVISLSDAKVTAAVKKVELQ